MWCRSWRFNCILLVFFRRWGRLVMRDLIKHDALLWLVGFQQLWLVHFNPRCFTQWFAPSAVCCRMALLLLCFFDVGGLAVASYIGETGRNLKTRLTEHKRATRNGDVNNHIAEHHRLTNHAIDWDSAKCVTYSTNYFQWLTLESWFTNLEQTPLNRCQQLPAPYKRLIHDINITNEPNRTT